MFCSIRSCIISTVIVLAGGASFHQSRKLSSKSNEAAPILAVMSSTWNVASSALVVPSSIGDVF